MTQITVKQMAAVKRVAMNVLPLTNKKAKLQAKIAEMEAEIKSLNEQIDVQQGYVKSFAGGLTTEQLVVRNENKVFEPNTEVVYFDEEKRVYVVKEIEVHERALTYGSDFDADKEAAEEVARIQAEADMKERIVEEAERKAEDECLHLETEEEAEEARQEEVCEAKEDITVTKSTQQASIETEIDPFA